MTSKLDFSLYTLSTLDVTHVINCQCLRDTTRRIKSIKAVGTTKQRKFATPRWNKSSGSVSLCFLHGVLSLLQYKLSPSSPPPLNLGYCPLSLLYFEWHSNCCCTGCLHRQVGMLWISLCTPNFCPEPVNTGTSIPGVHSPWTYSPLGIHHLTLYTYFQHLIKCCDEAWRWSLTFRHKKHIKYLTKGSYDV